MNIMVLHRHPLIYALVTLSFHDPYAPVVAPYHRPSTLRPPNPSGGGVIQLQPLEHGLLQVGDGETLDSFPPKEVNPLQIMKLHRQVHVAQPMHLVLSRHRGRHHGRQPEAVNRALAAVRHHCREEFMKLRWRLRRRYLGFNRGKKRCRINEGWWWVNGAIQMNERFNGSA